jgi:hypothetical protein
VTIIEQIMIARKYMPELYKYVIEMIEIKREEGVTDGAGIVLPVFNDDDELIGTETERMIEDENFH